jgi:hypothetical protein
MPTNLRRIAGLDVTDNGGRTHPQLPLSTIRTLIQPLGLTQWYVFFPQLINDIHPLTTPNIPKDTIPVKAGALPTMGTIGRSMDNHHPAGRTTDE